MSNNPWPFVTVALVSLAFLAKSIAQQDDAANPFAPASAGPAANIRFGEDFPPDLESAKRTDTDQPQIKFGDSLEEKKRQTLSNGTFTPNSPASNAASHGFSFGSATAVNNDPVRLGGIAETNNEDSNPVGGGAFNPNARVPRSPMVNRGLAEPFRGSGATLGSSRSPRGGSAARIGAGTGALRRWGEGESSGASPDFDRFSERTELAERTTPVENYWGQRSNPNKTTTPRNAQDDPMIDLRDGRPDPRAGVPDNSRTTREAGIMSFKSELPGYSSQYDRKQFKANKSPQSQTVVTGGQSSVLVRGGNNPGFRESAPNTRVEPAAASKLKLEQITNTEGAGRDPGTVTTTGSDEGTASSLSTLSGTKLPFWTTMALFASLAANLFFGWIAWDTHSRYQDFVEEMSESDTRRERRSRRMREEPATRASSTLRTREQDEADFLRGGIEV